MLVDWPIYSSAVIPEHLSVVVVKVIVVKVPEAIVVVLMAVLFLEKWCHAKVSRYSFGRVARSASPVQVENNIKMPHSPVQVETQLRLAPRRRW